jgi:hypothetical protein
VEAALHLHCRPSTICNREKQEKQKATVVDNSTIMIVCNKQRSTCTAVQPPSATEEKQEKQKATVVNNSTIMMVCSKQRCTCTAVQPPAASMLVLSGSDVRHDAH